MTHIAYLALGSNLGDRIGHIYDALEAIAPFAAVEETSFLYATAPAYVTDQPAFLNAACRVTTALSPQELLRALKHTETALGRTATVRYGPRIIDLDVLFYDRAVVETDELTVPHPRMAERAFVLAPLLDLAPDLRHPRLDVTIRELWKRLGAAVPPRVMPGAGRLWRWGERTYVMGVLNVTPDSFSGDGLATQGDPVAAAVVQAQRFVAEGADVLDVGGYSTRPGHADVPVDEEIRRVVPVVRALRSAVDIPIAVDTFRAEVAEAAFEAGAHWLNDVWGLRLSARLGQLAARHRAPLVLMHNRTSPPGPDRLPHWPRGTNYTDVIEDVRGELAELVDLARQAGVPRWLRIVDPGIGFGKTPQQHCALIDRLDAVKRLGYPLLFGSSRKGFIGKLLGGLPPEERLEGTLATNVLAVDRGADIVRVHDVKATVRALRMTDAIVRRSAA